MDNVEYLKESLNQGVNEELKRLQLKLEKVKNEINYVSSVPDLISKFPVLYGNSLEQKDKMVEVLPKVLISDFFRNSKVTGKTNYISFEDDEYEISFPTSHSKMIKVSKKSPIKYSISPLPLKPEVYEFINLWEVYQTKKDKTSERELVDLYSRITRKAESSFLFRKTVKMDKVERLVNLWRSHVEKYVLEVEKWEQKIEKEKESKIECEELMNEIKEDLILFKEHGWVVTYQNFRGLEDYKI